MRAKTFLTVIILVLVTLGANLYWGMPLHTGQIKKTTFADPVDRFLMPEISSAMASTAGFLDRYAIPSGNLENAPAASTYSVLGIADALVNVWTSVTIALVALVIGLVTGIKVLLVSLMQLKILAVLGITLGILLAPVLIFLLLAVVLVNLAYQESTSAYLAIIYLVAFVACIPAVVMFLQAIAVVRRWVVALLARQATELADGFSTILSERRVHKVGVKYEKQLRETQSAMQQPELADGDPQDIADGPDDEEGLEPAIAERWGNLLGEDDMEALIAQGDSISELDKAEDVSDREVGQLFEEKNKSSDQYLTPVPHSEYGDEETLIGDDEMTGTFETLKDIPTNPASQDNFRYRAPAADNNESTAHDDDEGEVEVEDFTGTFGTLKEIPAKSATAETFGFHSKTVDEVESTGERVEITDTERAPAIDQQLLDLELVEEDGGVEVDAREDESPLQLELVDEEARYDEPPLDLELVDEEAGEEKPKPAEDSPPGNKPALPDKRFRGTLTRHDRKKT